MSTTPRAALRLVFSEILTLPVPPMMEPYMVRMKKRVEMVMSIAREEIVMREVQVEPP